MLPIKHPIYGASLFIAAAIAHRAHIRWCVAVAALSVAAFALSFASRYWPLLNLPGVLCAALAALGYGRAERYRGVAETMKAINERPVKGEA